jgi:hypothetical protein
MAATTLALPNPAAQSATVSRADRSVGLAGDEHERASRRITVDAAPVCLVWYSITVGIRHDAGRRDHRSGRPGGHAQPGDRAQHGGRLVHHVSEIHAAHQLRTNGFSAGAEIRIELGQQPDLAPACCGEPEMPNGESRRAASRPP